VTGEIRFDSSSVEDVGGALGRASSGISASITILDSKLAGAAWTGEADLADTGAQAQRTVVMTEMNSPLKLAEKAAAAASTQLVDAEATVSGLCSRG
jgi:hypothetical protein